MSNFVLETIAKRRTVRKYSDESLSEEQIKSLANAALISPSARNRQPWHISAVSNRDLILEIEKDIIDYYVEYGPKKQAESNAERGNKIFYNAPLVFFISKEERTYSSIDVGIVAQSIALAAKSMGLDSAILGLPRVAFAEQQKGKWSKKLNFPEDYVYGIAVAVGYGEEPGRQREVDTSKITYLK